MLYLMYGIWLLIIFFWLSLFQSKTGYGLTYFARDYWILAY